MDKKMDVFCDITTGVCGPVGENSSGMMEFIDLSATAEEETDQEDEN